MINTIYKKTKYLSLEFLLLLILGLLYMTMPNLLRNSWFSVVVWIREAIHSGDGAKLFLASASVNFLYALLSFMAYFWSLLFIKFTFSNKNESTQRWLISVTYLIIRIISWRLKFPIEPALDIITIFITIILTSYARMSLKNINAEVVITLQIFIALQWTNTMPALSSFYIGHSELPASIKIAGAYLDNTFTQNIISLAFMIPLLLSATMTSMRFRANNMMMTILEENVQKAKELKDAQTKIMENRVYKEVNAMAHDLKTPLVTIRGLNSMLMLSKDMNKLIPYAERIDNAVEKMSELISGFLYGTHRRRISIAELIDYVRSQVPIDSDNINFKFIADNEENLICGNQIRLSRAIINIIENAIIATNTQNERNITLKTTLLDDNIIISIEDNGKGIDDDHINNLFDIGYSGVGSTGLGLPFAKQIIEEHEGTISISSELGLGTKVEIALPTCKE